MRAIVTGGGTGGHIYPAIAIADAIKKKEPDSQILYIGNEIGLEKDIVPGTGYPMEMVAAKWIDRSNALKIVDTGFTTLRGIRQSLRIMKRFRPEAVIGTGGYVCFPVLYAGHRYGARCFIHEQNAFPGMANKSLERFVDKVFLGFPEASDYFHEPEKHVVTGNPVRDSFFRVGRKEARDRLKIGEDQFAVFSFGGSQGAERINEVVFELMKTFQGNPGKVLIFGTGSQYYDEICEEIRKQGIETGQNIRVCSYIRDMPDYLAAADLVIGRAGALSVAEICVSGRPSILIPSPNVTGNHQYFNARSVADRGGAVLIEEKNLTPERLIAEVDRLESEPEKRNAMGEASRNCVPHNSAELIYEEIRKSL
ncbi:undecaprenyldiphospho-muramoylpentapeptide beta-N-acetylglucosaminyltransferase [Hornefia butyriciproducens]|uniref:undecaprenyldiphospho-muramoylpentapeptide beta-N-acetylglucosaminyltransferase n=1 Tax=Hornefia butyriciproducens TaxID=2652293 RepID=UPI002A917522|nr:undecaprenyldiphospho-muramoylpentapeptide beta-N-acetylglucosaminyltransferase [Hornefia butyriciproducens]MCI7412299.1 undecaprenyldiphospho-muramoylpentapeptide beta-N-acetylglucosaminyltransferase [Clostridiales bacterium]MDY6211321.1 undecaprenyldiphospho-muramoylpentapeptide beta-N-acetylglucosaminyltransferase [Hornefia butyriciproducens]